MIGKQDANGLRFYLRSLSEQLERKGVVADYLYYVLANEFGL